MCSLLPAPQARTGCGSLEKPFKSSLPLPPACWLAADKENMGRSAITRGGRDFGLSHTSKNLKTDYRVLMNLLSELIMAILAILHWLRLQVFVHLVVSAFLQEKWYLGRWHMAHFSSHLSWTHHQKMPQSFVWPPVCLRGKHKPVHRKNHC